MRSEATLDAVSRTADRWSDIADLVGRIALASLFLMSGVDKLFIHTAETIQLMQAYHVPLAGLLVYPSGVFELAAGLALAAGYRARLAGLLLRTSPFLAVCCMSPAAAPDDLRCGGNETALNAPMSFQRKGESRCD